MKKPPPEDFTEMLANAAEDLTSSLLQMVRTIENMPADYHYTKEDMEAIKIIHHHARKLAAAAERVIETGDRN